MESVRNGLPSMSDETQLAAAATQLADVLRQQDCRIVLAESCTGGLVSAALTRNPGISAYLCGSAVVYRNATKTQWLRISADQLDDPSIGPVSSQVAGAMAERVLEQTPEARVSVSVTGHLGPDAPHDLDGVVFIGLASRMAGGSGIRIVTIERVQLTASGGAQLAARQVRQTEAAVLVLQHTAHILQSMACPD